MDVRISKSAMKALMRSDKRGLLTEKINALSADPSALAANISRLKSRPESRLRGQNWRIIFRIEDEILWIDDVGPRGAIYQGPR